MVPWFWIWDAILLQFSIFFFYDANDFYICSWTKREVGELARDGNGETRQSEEEVGGKTYLEQIEY